PWHLVDTLRGRGRRGDADGPRRGPEVDSEPGRPDRDDAGPEAGRSRLLVEDRTEARVGTGNRAPFAFVILGGTKDLRSSNVECFASLSMTWEAGGAPDRR